MPDAPIDLEVIMAAVGAVSLAFTGSAAVDHYDMYRSTDESLVGDKINASPIAQPASPYDVAFVDDISHSVAPPSTPGLYFYRAVAVDSDDAISLPSSSVFARVGLPQTITPKRAALISVEKMGPQ